MTITQSPRGDFYAATQNGLTVFDRDRRSAILRLSAAIWNAGMPPSPYTEEWVGNGRVTKRGMAK